MCASAFADRLDVNVQEALGNLLSYREIAHLVEHFDIEHTLPLDDTVDSPIALCKRNDGALA